MPALQQELEEATRDANANRHQAEAGLAETRARISKLVTPVGEDVDAPRALTTRLKELEQEQAALKQVLATVPERQFICLPTNYESLYLRAVADLNRHLASGDAAAARQAIRLLIDKTVVQPGSARVGKRRPMQLHGDLFRMNDDVKAPGKCGLQTTTSPLLSDRTSCGTIGCGDRI